MMLRAKETSSSLVMANNEIRKYGIQCYDSLAPPINSIAQRNNTFEMHSWSEK